MSPISDNITSFQNSDTRNAPPNHLNQWHFSYWRFVHGYRQDTAYISASYCMQRSFHKLWNRKSGHNLFSIYQETTSSTFAVIFHTATWLMVATQCSDQADGGTHIMLLVHYILSQGYRVFFLYFFLIFFSFTLVWGLRFWV